VRRRASLHGGGKELLSPRSAAHRPLRQRDPLVCACVCVTESK
jgi:hypothetical protein